MRRITERWTESSVGRWMSWCFVLWLASCGQVQSDARLSSNTPFAVDEQGRQRLWASCPAQIEIFVDDSGAGLEILFEEARRAAAAWRLPHVPEIVIRRRKIHRPNEDGINSLVLGSASSHCAKTSALVPFCLKDGEFGSTRLASRPVQGLSRPQLASRPLKDPRPYHADQAEIVEADIVVERNMLDSPSRLRALFAHEFGHVLGLAHTSVSHETIMTPQLSMSARPGRDDVASILQAYRGACAREPRK